VSLVKVQKVKKTFLQIEDLFRYCFDQAGMYLVFAFLQLFLEYVARRQLYSNSWMIDFDKETKNVLGTYTPETF
jgi:hypothetical protein